MDAEKIEKLVEKILDSKFIVGENEKVASSHQPYGDPDTPVKYEDWIKQQPRSKK